MLLNKPSVHWRVGNRDKLGAVKPLHQGCFPLKNVEIWEPGNAIFGFQKLVKDGAYYCYCAYVLHISR